MTDKKSEAKELSDADLDTVRGAYGSTTDTNPNTFVKGEAPKGFGSSTGTNPNTFAKGEAPKGFGETTGNDPTTF